MGAQVTFAESVSISFVNLSILCVPCAAMGREGHNWKRRAKLIAKHTGKDYDPYKAQRTYSNYDYNSKSYDYDSRNYGHKSGRVKGKGKGKGKDKGRIKKHTRVSRDAEWSETPK